MGGGEPGRITGPGYACAPRCLHAVDLLDARDLADRLRAHAELHSDSKDILLEAAAMLAPTKES
jgi:hypothetical protein